MKIFNWVHRRFHNKENVKKEEQFEIDENVLEHWRGGILTIGTFGYDQLKAESEEINEDVVLSSHYEDDDDDEISDSEEEVDKDEEEEEKFMERNRREEVGFKYVMMEKKARTTLADLFNAETKEESLKKVDELVIKEKSKSKHGHGKKLMLLETRHIRKVHRVIRRMLKRKIHPDISLQLKLPLANNCDIDDHATLVSTQGAII